MTRPNTYAPRDKDSHPPYVFEPYKSTALRGPRKPLAVLPQTLSEITGPLFGRDALEPGDNDLTLNAGTGKPALGERIIVAGRVLGDDGRPVPNTLLEVWQCNAAGRYHHVRDQHDAPLDPNFAGAGRCITDAEGNYSFTTIRPGAYPWGNHPNAWRPAHIHFSIFGESFLTRLVTQMFFPGDPLIPFDPIFNCTPDKNAANRLIAAFDLDLTQPEWALGYRWDIVLRGRNATPMET